MFALCGPSGQAQDKKAEPASQQDRVEFAGALDSWYKITLGGDSNHVGYAHVVLDRVASGGPWRYTFTVDSETEIMLPDPKDPEKQIPSVESLRIRAKLDDTYAPIDWQQTNHLDGIDVNLAINTDETGARKGEIVYSPTQRSPLSVGAEEEYFYSRFLMFVSLRQNGNLARPGPRKATLLHVQSADKPPFVELDLNIEPMVKREYLGKKDISVTRVLYRKPPPARVRELELQEAYVDRYGRPVEEIARNGLRILLVRGEDDAVSKALLRQGARRDPFRKDLALSYVKDANKSGRSGESAIAVDPGSFDKVYKDAKGLLDELQKAKDEAREADGDALYSKVIDHYDALKKSLADKAQTPDVLRQVEDLRKRAEEIWGGIERLMKELQATNVRILEAASKDDCAEMEKGVEKLRKAQDSKILRDRPELVELANMIAKADPLIAKCKTRLELAKKKVVLSGTISYEDWSVQAVDASIVLLGHQIGGSQNVRFIKPNRLAIINEKTYKVGDVVDGEGVRVEKIWPHGVQVSLRDETRDVGIRQ
ncbi:MAG TPA: hypothetical protein VEN81_09210 [Planctomycetota bacterium]|nr:hypothetical protein [Planctomycetota bacterium]